MRPSVRSSKPASTTKSRPTRGPVAREEPPTKLPAPRPKRTPASSPKPLTLADAARATGLREDEVLDRALRAFAAAHGFDSRASVEPEPRSSPPALPPSAPPQPGPEDRPPTDATPPLAPAVRLYVKATGRAPQEMIGDTFTVGSSQKCDLWVSSPKIETRHLRIVREGTRYFAEDLHSVAGTVFDGRPLTGRHEIAHDDRLFLAGYHELRFYLLA